MSDLGFYALRLALVVAVAGVAAGVFGGIARRAEWGEVARRAVLVHFGLLTLAMGALLYSFATLDFTLEYVASHAARSMSVHYRMAALWGGQAGSLLLWAWMLGAYGAAALLVGTVTLYRDGISMSWIPMVVGIVGISLMMVTGMPTMVRTRFSTPTIGREWMIGQTGIVIEAVAPDGVVSIDDALWRARTNRATPVAEGDTIRVVAVEGLVLEIEPEAGGARDYRERRGSHRES